MTLEPQILAFLAALKVKLMVRRPMTALVEQGILPSTRTSPALHLQRRKLERAKMGDMLRAKIARRPDRQELVHRHILEDVPPRVDPSLCDKQRQLKRARLVDMLNSQLSQRPGPLELIQKNILHTDDPVEQAVKEGQLRFRATAEGRLDLAKVGVPSKYMLASSHDEDYSSSDEVESSPDASASRLTSPCLATTGSASVVKSGSIGNISGVQTLSSSAVPDSRRWPSSNNSSGVFAGPRPSGSTSSAQQHQTYNQRSAPGKNQTRKKKAKSKAQVKPRAIKFHEYKVRF